MAWVAEAGGREGGGLDASGQGGVAWVARPNASEVAGLAGSPRICRARWHLRRSENAGVASARHVDENDDARVARSRRRHRSARRSLGSIAEPSGLPD